MKKTGIAPMGRYPFFVVGGIGVDFSYRDSPGAHRVV